MGIIYSEQPPPGSLTDFVFTFWKTQNTSGRSSHYTILPDAGIELIIAVHPDSPAQVSLSGLATKALEIIIPDQTVLFGIRFKLLAVEYLLRTTLPANSVQELPRSFWELEEYDALTLDNFVDWVSSRLNGQLGSLKIDPRKQKLLNLVYTSKGSLSVDALAWEAGWAARQINRYFTHTFGLSLKEYLEQLSFFSSLPQIRQGQFSPRDHYYDQSHFIRQIKKHSGRTPKQLYQQRNSRFIQLGDEFDG